MKSFTRKNGLFVLFILCSICSMNCLQVKAQENENSLTLIKVQKIWDKAPHNAFTDLIRYKDRWFCVFREGKAHNSSDGSLRIITSTNGEEWETAAQFTSLNSDLREAKITVTPKGKLMLIGTEAYHDKSVHTHQSSTWLSDDGFKWSKSYKVGHPDMWLWKSTWHKGNAYAFGYTIKREPLLRLYSSTNGKKFKTLVDLKFNNDWPNETSIAFKGDSAFCLLRRDGEPNTGKIGTSVPPYTQWKWKDLGIRICGPHMIILPDGRFLAIVRLYDGVTKIRDLRTSICWINPHSGKITEALKLPSGGDTSYAGIVSHNGILWVSYYSTHEEKTSIYLAQIKINP